MQNLERSKKYDDPVAVENVYYLPRAYFRFPKIQTNRLPCKRDKRLSEKSPLSLRERVSPDYSPQGKK
jgi:hypothetical protein